MIITIIIKIIVNVIVIIIVVAEVVVILLVIGEPPAVPGPACGAAEGAKFRNKLQHYMLDDIYCKRRHTCKTFTQQ